MNTGTAIDGNDGRWARPSLVIAMLAMTLLSFASLAAESTDRSAGIMVPNASSRSTDNSVRAPTVIRGTGALVREVPQDNSSAPEASENGFQLNFVDIPIATVVSAVIGDGLEMPYVIDPQVKGNMTLQATRPLTREETLAALESALKLQGFALLDVKGVLNIVPSKDAARRSAAPRIGGPANRGFGITIVPLQFVSASDMEKVLQPFAPEGAVLRVDNARNLLLIAGTSQELANLKSVIDTFDVDWLSGMSFALYPLEHVDAATISAELKDVFAGDGNPIGGVVRLVPLSRLNSLMVVTPRAQYLDQVQNWIKRLDVQSGGPGRRIYVYDVQNAKADDLAKSLSSILSIDSGSSAPAPATLPTTSTTATSTALTTTTAAQPTTTTRPTAAASSGTSDMRIVPNAENNSLLILASPAEYSVIEAALQRLDVVPIQVLIEASIAEVTLTDDLRYGLQWAYQSKNGPVVLSEGGSASVAQQLPGFSYLFNARADIRAVLNSIESLTKVHVLSSPHLMVLNNREAQLQVGDQVPIAVQAAQSTVSSDAPLINTVQLRDTGVILRVTPRANRSGRVTLEVSQEVSDVVPTTTSGINSPTIQQRKLSSIVTVDDGQTIALGGMIRDSSSNGGSGLPFLRRIPLLGALTGSTSRSSQRTELIVLLTPKVIRSEPESDEAMKELRDQFKNIQRALPSWKKTPTS